MVVVVAMPLGVVVAFVVNEPPPPGLVTVRAELVVAAFVGVKVVRVVAVPAGPVEN